MIRVKKFDESTESGGRLTREDLEEYFIEFIDDGNMKFHGSTYFQSNTYIKSIFSIGDKLCRKFGVHSWTLTENYDVNILVEMLNRINTVCRQWNLDFTLRFGHQDARIHGLFSLEIRQPLPDDVIEHLCSRTIGVGVDSQTQYHQCTIKDTFFKFYKKITVNENNEIFVQFTNCTVSAPTWKMTAADRRRFATLDQDVIKYFENDFPVKMKFEKFAESDDPKYHDSKSFKFKII